MHNQLPPEQTVKLVRWEPLELSGKSVRYGDPKDFKVGFFFASGSKEKALVIISPQVADEPAFHLWQSAVDRIEKAAPTDEVEFTCYV